SVITAMIDSQGERMRQGHKTRDQQPRTILSVPRRSAEEVIIEAEQDYVSALRDIDCKNRIGLRSCKERYARGSEIHVIVFYGRRPVAPKHSPFYSGTGRPTAG